MTRFRVRGNGVTWVMERIPDLKGRDRLSWGISSLDHRNLRIRGIVLVLMVGGASRGMEQTDEMEVWRAAVKDMAWTEATRGGTKGMGWIGGLGVSRDVLRGTGWTEDLEAVRGVLEDMAWTEGKVTLTTITIAGRADKESFRQSRIGEDHLLNRMGRGRHTIHGHRTDRTR